MYRLRLFGAPSLEENGEPVSLGRRKAMALLAYLAATQSRHRREELATLLWPESGQDAAHSALRNAIWILRQSPISDLIRADRSSVSLVEGDQLRVDIARFRELVRSSDLHGHPPAEACSTCAPALREAVDISSAGPFMQSFSLPNTSGFDDWQIAEREALQRDRIDVLTRLVGFYHRQNELDQALHFARLWLESDPLNEEAHRMTIRFLSNLGRRGEAIRCYERCREILQRELGLEPDRTTVELAEQVRQQPAESDAMLRPRNPTNLPSVTSQFVGRRQESAQLRELLTSSESRLVSLVGLGGSGKSRLAVKTGHDLLPTFSDGVFVIPVPTDERKGHLATAMAEVVKTRLTRGEHDKLETQLIRGLRDREMLLILDGMERAQEQAPFLVDLLSGAPNLRVLVTSREPMQVGAETVLHLHGLPTPDPEADAEDAASADAIQLLRVLSRRFDPSFDPTPEDLGGMGSAARLVDGFPLGLELAAAWSRTLPWNKIAARIASSLDFLTSTQRDRPERHRSLRTIFDQTWNLLPEGEQATLRRLAVFEGGFSSDAAEEIAGAPASVLAALVNKCLIRRGSADRYHLHELLRQFARERLNTEEEKYDTLKAHSAYYLDYVVALFGQLKGRRQNEALQTMRQDLENIRSAWMTAIEIQDVERLKKAASGLFLYYDMRTHFDEAAILFSELAQSAETFSPVDPLLKGYADLLHGWFLHDAWPIEAEQLVENGLAALTEQPFGEVAALGTIIASYAMKNPDAEAIASRLEQSIAFYRSAEDRWGEALALAALSRPTYTVDPEQAETLGRASLRLHREIGDYWGEALILFSLAAYDEEAGRYGQAKVRYTESQRLLQRIGRDVYGVIDCLVCRARLARRLGETEEAAELTNEAGRLARRIGNSRRLAGVLTEMAELRRGANDPRGAIEQLQEAFDLLRDLDAPFAVANCAVTLGDLWFELGDPMTAEGWYHEALSYDSEHPAALDGLRQIRAAS